MNFRSVAIVIAATGCAMISQAQTISFNSPLPWVTLRNDTITVRAQIDTAALKNKQISITLLSAANGKTSVVANKKFKLTEPSSEFAFGRIRKNLIGGESYLKVKWEIKGSTEKGEIEPIGIADLSTLKNNDTLKAVHVDDNAATADVATKAAPSLSLGNVSYGLAWNKKALYVVLKKSSAGDTLTVALDGKCGKNAFLSYPDRFIETVLGETVSADGYHFERSVRDNRMTYERKAWQCEITQETVGDVIVVTMPWYDSGIIPFEERSIGAVAVVSNKTKKTVPAKANVQIPATWGVIQLQK